mgnify:CR=1 FL=1
MNIFGMNLVVTAGEALNFFIAVFAIVVCIVFMAWIKFRQWWRRRHYFKTRAKYQ